MPAPTTPHADPANSAAPDDARALVADQLAMLKRVAEVGLEVALEVERQARGEAPEGAKPAALGDIALAYARTARAMRLTVMLQSRLVRELKGLDDEGAQASAGAAARADEARLGLEEARKGSVERIVGRVAEAAGRDEDEAEALVLKASERLDDDDLYGDVLARPVSEIVADICTDLGLRPDWPRLAAEAWAEGERAAGPPGAPLQGLEPSGRPARPPPPPFHALRRTPVRAAARPALDPDGDDDEEEDHRGPIHVRWLGEDDDDDPPERAVAGVPP